MAETTHRGITYTTSGSATITVDLDLPLQAGVDQDETTWLGANYPGSLDSFEPRQSDGANRHQPRLLCLQLGDLADAETLTLSGDCNVILTHMSSGNEIVGAAAAPRLATSISGLRMTATCKLSSDGTTADTMNALVWLLVA